MASAGAVPLLRWGRSDPQLVDAEVALAAANPFERLVIRRLDFPGFLRLRRT